MILIQRALCFPDPGETFTYSKHVCKYYRKFLRSYEVNQFALKGITTRIFYLVGSCGYTDFGKIHTGSQIIAPFFSTRRIVVIQRALCFPNPGEAFT